MVNPETLFLWRDARRAYNAPEPPEDFTEYRWMGLLFETICEVRRRLCFGRPYVLTQTAM